MIKTTGLFIITNLAVMAVFGIVMNLLGLQGQDSITLLIFAAIFGFGGAIVSLLMSKKMALKSVGATIITEPKTEQEHWLFDVVKRQADQVNLKMPDITIYQANDMNAFATGARRNHALVAVSSALLETMTRDEAEAVIAHEISHIANGDMLTMTLLQGILNTFVIFISRILATIVSQAIAQKNRSLARMIYFFVAILFEFLFGLLASIITMWFSRRREFRADSGAANLVGPDKMIAALERLKVSHEPAEEETITAFCINGAKKAKLSELFLSHPPLDKRIEALKNSTHLNEKSELVS